MSLVLKNLGFFRRVDDAENILTPLKLGNVKNKGHERLLQQIRTNPPSPQCFSDNRTASLKALVTKPTVCKSQTPLHVPARNRHITRKWMGFSFVCTSGKGNG